MTDRPTPDPASRGDAAGRILALDTATSRVALAVAASDGSVLAARSWVARQRHGEELFGELAALLEQAGVTLSDLDGLVVGLGPGGFTGLRVGLAAAKTIAWGLRRPIVGMLTPLALAVAAGRYEATADTLMIVQPAGPRDRYATRVALAGGDPKVADGPRLLAPGDVDLALAATGTLVAVDLPEASEIPADALDLGRLALEGLPGALVELGAAALATGRVDDLEALVPAYVTLPRGIPEAVGVGSWSPDLP